MGKSINILSLNVGMSNSLAGLSSLITAHSVDLVLLQEIRISSEQLSTMLGGLGFKGEANIDESSPFSPGTAVAWKTSLPVEQVSTIVNYGAQIVKLGSYVILNVHAPSGSSRKQERHIFFSREIFRALCLFPNCKPLLSGDFNCILSEIDVDQGAGF